MILLVKNGINNSKKFFNIHKNESQKVSVRVEPKNEL